MKKRCRNKKNYLVKLFLKTKQTQSKPNQTRISLVDSGCLNYHILSKKILLFCIFFLLVLAYIVLVWKYSFNLFIFFRRDHFIIETIWKWARLWFFCFRTERAMGFQDLVLMSFIVALVVIVQHAWELLKRVLNVDAGFVQRNGTHFILNGKPHYVNGFNAYWLMNTASDPSTRSMVTSTFQQASQHGFFFLVEPSMVWT